MRGRPRPAVLAGLLALVPATGCGAGPAPAPGAFTPAPQTEVSLFDRTGDGRPDVVFGSLIFQSTLDRWAPGADDPCTAGGTLYCLRNDLSQTVLT
jgi:hypothetical protein